MTLTVAGIKKEFEDGITVAKLIELENVETPEYVTVTVNDEFVESGTFAETTLKDNDTVEFLYFMGGGQRTAAPNTPEVTSSGSSCPVIVNIG